MTATPNNPLSPATSASDTEQRYHAGGAFAMKELGMASASNGQQASGEARHTPGEWRWSRLNWRNEIDNDRLYICAENERGFFTGVCIVEGNRTSQITTEANAHLIAAAPDLLAACEAVVKHASITEDEDGGPLAELSGDYIDALRSAIAKAKGGAA